MITTYVQPTIVSELKRKFYRIKQIDELGETKNFWDYELDEKELADTQYVKLLEDEEKLIKAELT